MVVILVFLLGWPIFSGYVPVSFRESMLSFLDVRYSCPMGFFQVTQGIDAQGFPWTQHGTMHFHSFTHGDGPSPLTDDGPLVGWVK